MTEKDLDEILMRPRKCRDNLARCNEELRNARLKAESNGAIRYDLDKIIKSASDDGVPNKVQAIIEAETRVRDAELQLKQAVIRARALIMIIEEPTVREIAYRYYIELQSTKSIAYRLLMSESTVIRRKRAIKSMIIHKA